jgi:acetylornithine/succinyldiaminopimelate/putrescine aminotransferase
VIHTKRLMLNIHPILMGSDVNASNPHPSRLNPDRHFLLQHIHFDKAIVRAEGHYLYDAQGQAYLDFLAQYGSVPFGHNPSVIWDALNHVRESLEPSLVQPLLSPAAEELSASLGALAPCRNPYVTFTNSGAETVEAAIKLARAKTLKPFIVSTQGGFHGKTLGAVSATWNPKYREPFLADTRHFDFVPYGDARALEARLAKGDVAAFLVEPVQGEAGMIDPPAGYLRAVAEVCRKHRTLFIADEIQSGLGRTGKLFALEHEDVEADMILVAKALGGGMLSLGACICAENAWSEEFGLFHSSTFANNHLACTAGLAVIEALTAEDQALVRDVAKKGRYLRQGLERLAGKYPKAFSHVTGMGLMQGLHVRPWQSEDSYFITHASWTGMAVPLLCGYLLNQHKILTAPTFNNSGVLRIEPSLTVTYAEIDRLLHALDDIGQAIERENFVKLLRYLTIAPRKNIVPFPKRPEKRTAATYRPMVHETYLADASLPSN